MLKQLAVFSLALSVAAPVVAQQAPQQKDPVCIQRAHKNRVAAKRSAHARTKASADTNWLKAVRACPNIVLFDPGEIKSPKVTTGSGSR